MSVINMREKPIVKPIDLFPVFLRIKIRSINRLELSELNLDIVRKPVVIVVDRFLLLNIDKCRSSRASLVFGVRILIKFRKKMYSGDRVLKVFLISEPVTVNICLARMTCRLVCDNILKSKQISCYDRSVRPVASVCSVDRETVCFGLMFSFPVSERNCK